MRLLVALAAAALVCTSTLALAQAPQLLAKNPNDPSAKPHPITLAKADVSLLAAGHLAQTTMTLTFANDADRVLEGELVFPLPEGAAVSGYALNVGDELVDAVTIEKEKARQVFETEVRKGIDPGLIEQVQGNNFRTRVYPIPAKGTRTIRVQYVAPALTKGDLVTYPLPVRWPGATPQLSLRVESVSATAPDVANVPGLKFTSDGNRHVAEVRFDKSSFEGEVAATLPAKSLPAAVVEKRTRSTVSAENLDPKAAEQFAKVDHYFVLSDVPQFPPTNITAPVPARPARIAIAWDASLSRGNVDHAKEFALIAKHLAALGDVTVEVVPFRNVPERGKTFRVNNGDATAIIKHLSGIAYDGGTNLAAVEFTKNRITDWDEGPAPVAYYLLFTDGLTNLGPDMPSKIDVPVFAISDDPRSNHALLRRIANQSGGQYVNLKSLNDADALAALGDRPVSLISIDADPNEVADLYPRLPQPVQGRVTVAGRLLARSAKVTLNYGRGGAVTLRVPFTLTQDGAAEANLVSRYWAQARLADLSIAAEANERDITALGKQFNLVTPYTSMIVLETVEQYLTHKIVPPKSRAGVYAEFMKRIEQQQQVAQKEEGAKIDRVVAMWNARLAWWNQEFKYAADFKYREETKKDALAAAGGRELTLGGSGAPATAAERFGSLDPGELQRSARPAPAGGIATPARRPAAPAAAPADAPPTADAPAPVAAGPRGHNEPLLSSRPGEPAVTGVASASPATPPVNAPRPHPEAADDASTPRVGNFDTRATAGTTRLHAGAGFAPRGLAASGDGAAAAENSVTRGRFDERLAEDRLRQSEDADGDGIADGRDAGRPLGRLEQRARNANPATRPGGGQGQGRPGVALKAWTPDSPYMKALAAAPAAEAYFVYLDQRKAYADLPAFYLDCADFFAKGSPDLAVRILTNIPELALDDGRLLCIAAHRMQQIGRVDLAIDLFERVAKLRPEEPQSFRDLALALADRADGYAATNDPDRARSDYERSLQLLHKVVMNPWQRFEEIEVIALTEANRVLAQIADRKLQIANPFDPRLVKLLDPDLRIVMTWDTDNTDIDLHVTEPTGETCVYNHNRTAIGGALSRDFTQGYGPEEYLLRKLMPGQYKIQAHFYGNRDQRLIGPTTVQATVITNYGRPDEKRQSLTLRLKDAKDMVDVGTVTLGK